MTATPEQAPVRSTADTAISVTALDLKMALKTLPGFCTKPNTGTPALSGANLAVTDGALTLTATDRYKMIRHTVPLVSTDIDGNPAALGDPDMLGVLSVANIKALSAWLGTSPSTSMAVRIETDEDRLKLTMDTGASTTVTLDKLAVFPRVAHLLTEGDRHQEVAAMSMEVDNFLVTLKAFKDLGFAGVDTAHGNGAGKIMHVVGINPTHRKAHNVKTLVAVMPLRMTDAWSADNFR